MGDCFKTLQIGMESSLVVSMLRRINHSIDHSDNSFLFDVELDGSVNNDKLSLKMQGLHLFFQLDWAFYIVYVAKTASKRIEVLAQCMKFQFFEVFFYHYKSLILLCLE